jgi:hypothetical protein
VIELIETERLPPLHVPSDRELLARVGPWEVRRHAVADERFAYFASRALLHLQLWHPEQRISVLTPSRLTGGRFELARGARRASVANWAGVVAQLPDHDLPGSAELVALTMSLVVRCEVAAIRPRIARGEAAEERS